MIHNGISLYSYGYVCLDPYVGGSSVWASQYDAAGFGAVSSGTIVTLDGVPGVVEYTAPGISRILFP